MTKRDSPKGPVKATGERPAADEGRDRTDEYTVSLPTFEGPLDLLLHLIQKHELDIRDIPLAFITEKYVEYIRMMEQLSIDIASEYLVMAATLAYLKSKTLLPPSPEEEDDAADAEEEDPRAELVRRLLEYQKYKLVADQLGSRTVYGRDVFSRGAPAPEAEGPAPLAQLSMFKLLDALESVLERFKQTGDHLVDFDRISISDRINQLSDVLQQRGRVEFGELFEKDRSRADVIVTFLALLEMTKLRLTNLWQEQPYAPIFIELAVRDDVSDAPPAGAAEGPLLPRRAEVAGSTGGEPTAAEAPVAEEPVEPAEPIVAEPMPEEPAGPTVAEPMPEEPAGAIAAEPMPEQPAGAIAAEPMPEERDERFEAPITAEPSGEADEQDVPSDAEGPGPEVDSAETETGSPDDRRDPFDDE